MHFSVIYPKWHTEAEKKTIKKSDTARRQQIEWVLQSDEHKMKTQSQVHNTVNNCSGSGAASATAIC